MSAVAWLSAFVLVGVGAAYPSQGVTQVCPPRSAAVPEAAIRQEHNVTGLRAADGAGGGDAPEAIGSAALTPQAGNIIAVARRGPGDALPYRLRDVRVKLPKVVNNIVGVRRIRSRQVGATQGIATTAALVRPAHPARAVRFLNASSRLVRAAHRRPEFDVPDFLVRNLRRRDGTIG